MKLFVFLCFSQALLCALVCGHHGGPHDDDHDHHDQPHHKNESEALHQMSTATFKFSYSFFYHLAASYPHDNFFYSPMSISIAFSLLSLGAKSKTLSQIHEGLCYNTSSNSEEMIHKGFQKLLKIFKGQKDGFKLDMANALFTDNNLNLLEEFKDKVKKFYQSEAIATDFHKVQEAVDQINSYVEKKTNGNIKDLLDNLEPLTALVIINTVFFKGSWVDAFNVDHTREEDFHVDENTVVKVPMMTRQGEYNIGYISEAECTVVEVPYKGNITAIFMLPDKGKLHDTEKGLQNLTEEAWNNAMKSREIILSIPKFSFSGELDLVKELKHLGITDVFSDHADLSGITEDSRLKVSKAVHKAVLKMDEEGTEASAATAVGITKISLPQHIKINRPFFISIYKKDISVEVFSGRIINPTK
ncbi:alpha-1-antitrypsin-like protein GS55-MS [Phyllobates terribilis]|uniref:alpha-1-antitrypsin-like protein GS55-MS n=1 Tax=Phyllobates terribilis TaxID=111132 RepID=UPI003CCAD64A